MSISEYGRALMRGWVMIVVLAIFGGGVGYLLAQVTPESYRSSGALMVTSDRGNSTSELVQGSTYVQNLVATYVLLAKSEIVLQPVIEELGLESTPQSLASVVSASSPLDSVIIEISATSESPKRAQEIASGVIASLAETVTSSVAPTDSEGRATVRLTVIDNANQPKYPYAPSTRNNTLFGALIGGALGVLLALVRAFFWQSVRSRRDLTRATNAPVLGEVFEAKRGETLSTAVLGDPLGVEAESLRGVAANLSFLKVDGGLKSFVVTSALPVESKSSFAVSISLVLAESGRRVLLLDADLRSPSIASYTQLDGSIGLTTVLIGDVGLKDAAQTWGADNLSVLTAGATPPNPGQLLASDAMRQLLEQARSEYDIVVVDAAPLLPVTDAKWLSSMTDGVIFATRYGKTSLHAFERGIDTAEAGEMTLLGTVLTRVPRRGLSRYGAKTYGSEQYAAKD